MAQFNLVRASSGVPGRPTSEFAADPVPSVKPAVRPPFQAVGDVVVHLVFVKTVQKNFRRAVRHVVAVAVRDENEIGRGNAKDAAKPGRNPCQSDALVPENGPFVEMARGG